MLNVSIQVKRITLVLT